jgi:hypothetical protein
MNIIEKSLESELFFQAKDRSIVEKLVGLMLTKKVKKKEFLLKQGEICKEVFLCPKRIN